MTRVGNVLRRRVRALRAEAERGTSLMELVVGMAIMAVFMGIFTGAIVMMTSTSNKVEASTIASTQTSQALITLDKSVRYAAAVTTPGVSSGLGDWYVEWNTTTNNANTCTQLRVEKTAQQLQSRTWTMSSTGAASTPTSWTPLASNITNGAAAAGSADAPFTAPTGSASAASRFQQLTVTLVAQSGNTSTSTNRAQMTFSALNGTAGASTNAAACGQVARP